MKAANVGPKSDPKDGSEEDYEAGSALDTLMRAEEIKKNTDLLKRVAKRAGRKMKAVSSLKRIKEIRQHLSRVKGGLEQEPDAADPNEESEGEGE